jgi:hypothetical protein
MAGSIAGVRRAAQVAWRHPVPARATAAATTGSLRTAAQSAHLRSLDVLAAAPVTCGACGGDFTA